MEETVERPEAKRRFILIDLVVRLVREKPLGTVGGVIVLIFMLVAIFANFIAPYPYDEIHTIESLKPPSAQYWLGTDFLGRDLLSRIIYGARISMLVGVIATVLDEIVTAFIAIPCGYLGGKFDIIVQRWCDAFMCFPALFLYLTVMSILGQGLVQVILVLGVAGGLGGSRLMRSVVIQLKENVYVEASRAVGCSVWRIFLRHIIPNIMPIIIVRASMEMAGKIMAEATLSFLGFGVPPPIPTWGGMLSGDARKYMISAPWMAIWPGLALAIVIYGINMLGDGIRDILDPRLRGGLGSYRGGKKVKETLAKKLRAV